MTGARCAYCNAPATEPDHLTGRCRKYGRYLDPLLQVPSCRMCNLTNEHAWSATGLLVVNRPLLVVRMGRLAYGTARLHDTGWTGPVDPAFWDGLRSLALDVAAELEQRT